MEPPKTEAWSLHDQVLQYKVHIGLWTNWSRGQVLGQTLTVSRQNGNLLIAFTAFFIAFVGSRFWRIACFGLHRHYSTSHAKDTIHHQRQIILRNTLSADSAVLLLSQMFWAWRRSSRPFFRLLPALLMAVFCVSAFTVAGGFSSQISSSAGTEVLINGSACGLAREGELNGAEAAHISQMTKNALNYVQQCYSNATGLMDCNAFVTERIPTYVNNTSACPFSSSICRTNASNIYLDTGFVDSHHHLGVNAPENQRILFRQVAQCAPLVTLGHTTPYQSNGTNYTLYQYGSSIWSFDNLNFTYKVKDIQHQYNSQPGDRTESNYLLVSFSSYALNGSTGFISDFIPLDELWRTDADTNLIFLSGNGVHFVEPLNDMWYRATAKDRGISNSRGIRKETYHSPDAASPMGCTTQFQFCFRNAKTCGPIGGFIDAVAGAFEILGINKSEVWDGNADLMPGTTANPAASRFAWFASIVRYTVPSIGDIFIESGPDALTSSQTLAGGLQAPIPLNQWQIDITHTWAVIMAFWQSTFVETARGPTDPELAVNRLAPMDAAQQQICSNQIRSTDYTSFNFFALLFTYIFGLFIVAISFALEPVFEYLHQNRGYATYAHLEWTTNSVLQLHRLIHDNSDDKSLAWSHCVDTVPTTVAGVPLPSLDIGDTKHPRLERPIIPPASTLVEGPGSFNDPGQDYELQNFTSLPNSQVDTPIRGESELTEVDDHSRPSSHTESSEMGDSSFFLATSSNRQELVEVSLDALHQEPDEIDRPSSQRLPPFEGVSRSAEAPAPNTEYTATPRQIGPEAD